jgi:hypothetical protein
MIVMEKETEAVLLGAPDLINALKGRFVAHQHIYMT